MPFIVRLNCETRKPFVYGPSAFVSQPFLFEKRRGQGKGGSQKLPNLKRLLPFTADGEAFMRGRASPT